MIIPFRLTEEWSAKIESNAKVKAEFITEDMARVDNRGLKAEDDLIASTHHF